MTIADPSGILVAADIRSASPPEATPVEAAMKSRFVEKTPARIMGDKAYDSDPLDNRLLKNMVLS